jgi:hypothetical protein
MPRKEMNAAEILDKRINTALRRYGAALQDAALRVKWEAEKLESGHPEKYFEVGSLSTLNDLLKQNVELSSLLALKDQIQNQAREEAA